MIANIKRPNEKSHEAGSKAFFAAPRKTATNLGALNFLTSKDWLGIKRGKDIKLFTC
jgi:hypothetical protein